MKSIVVVGYEHTLAGGRALLEAGREAACRGADVSVIHAYHPGPAANNRDAADTAAATATFGADILRHNYPGLTVRAEAFAGVPYEVLAAAARGADLLVLGSSHEDGRAEQPLGPVAEWTLLSTPCPVMVVRGPERYPRGVVLAAIDVQEQAEEVVNFAFAEARFHSARLQAVSAFDAAKTPAAKTPAGVGATGQAPDDPRAEAQAALDQILAQRMERHTRVRAGGELIDGPPASVLTAAAARADLVVTGARRRGNGRVGIRIGPVTDALLRCVVRPVVVVPHF